MTGLAAGAGASSLAHGIHFTVLGIGLLGLVALLAPWTPLRTPPHPTDHELRIAALRRAIAAGSVDARGAVMTALAKPSVSDRPDRDLWLPLAVVSTAAAAAVHAAVGPEHFREQVLVGWFFALAALTQLAWSIVASVHADRRTILLGAVVNAGLVSLWLVTRTVGVPGLLPQPEQVGPWDLACVAWELVAVGACVRALGVIGSAYRLGSWARWDRRVQLWAGVSVVGLGLLSISGAGA